MTEHPTRFVTLEPPAGGLQRLHRTIDGKRLRRNHAGWRWVTGTLAVSMLVAAWLLPGAITRQRQADKLTDAVLHAMAPSDNRLHVVNGDALEWPTGQADVRLFFVQSVPRGEH